MCPANQPSHPINPVIPRAPLDSGRVATSGYLPPVPPLRVPVRRMPRLGRCVARAFVHVAKKRYYLGAYNDPAVRELYARLTRVWGRTGHIDLSLIHEARHTATDHRTTIAELGLKFRHYAEQRRWRKEHRDRWCWHPHQLRHNYATMIRKRFGIEEASNMLDHSSVKMTEVYAERDREQAMDIANKVG